FSRLGLRIGFALDVFLAYIAAAEDEACRVFLHDLVLKPHQTVEQRLGTWGTSGYVHINRHNSVDALKRRVGWERAARRSTGTHRYAPLGFRHLIPHPLDNGSHL